MADLCRPGFLRATNSKHICAHWASNPVTPVGIEKLRVYGIRGNLGSAVLRVHIPFRLINIDSAIHIRDKLFAASEVDADILWSAAVSCATALLSGF